MLHQFHGSHFGYNAAGIKVQASRPIRRAKLAAAINRQRRILYALKIARDGVPQRPKDMHTSRIEEITKELHRMEIELHELNVQQIREELKEG